MKKILSTIVLFSALSVSASAANMLDQAMNINLDERASAQKEYSTDKLAPQVRAVKKNDKYKSVEVIEVGDELGGFVAAKPTWGDHEKIIKKADSDTSLEHELKQADPGATL